MPQDFCRQEFYEEDDRILAAHGIVPGIKTIDDKWQTHYGTNEVDVHKWPDLPSYIKRCHEMGQRVLMWLPGYQCEGLSADLCIRNKRGVPVAVDPTNPKFVKCFENQLDYILSADGLDADGFKVDFTARIPSGQTLQIHGEKWGVALQHAYIELIHSAIKRIKPDSMNVCQIPNPWFVPLVTAVRLNDVFTGSPLNSQMEHRAKVTEAAGAELVRDTDNWPMPSKAAWRGYLKIQPDLGVPWLYFSDQVAGEKMTEADYAAIRRSWTRYRASVLAEAERKNLLYPSARLPIVGPTN